MKRGISRVILLITLATAVAACKEQRTFTPVDPSVVAARVTDFLENHPFAPPQALAAGRAGVNGGLVIYEGENPSGNVLIDWTSAANHLTVALVKRGSASGRPVNGPQPPLDDCSVPLSIASGGSPIGGMQSRPPCPIVLSNTTRDKPKTLEIRNLSPGFYDLVITNNGPGNETFRSAFLGN